jgi:hypothetical protein
VLAGLLLPTSVAPLADGATTPAAGPAEPRNWLDHPIVDMAVLGPGADREPRLLTVDAHDAPGRVTVRILERDAAWSVVAERSIGLPTAGLGEMERPWLVGLGPGAFALIATAPEGGRSALVGFGIRPGSDPPTLEVGSRSVVKMVIDDAGPADVDADGTSELVVASATTRRRGPLCQGSELLVLDETELRPIQAVRVADRRLAGGVIGRWDESPGDDLLAYAFPNCPAGPDTPSEARLMAIRLRDGMTIVDRPAAGEDAVPWLSAPMRLDLDGEAPDEALARDERGLVVLDPARGWAGTVAASPGAIPLVAGPDGAGRGGAVRSAGPGRIAWLDPTAPSGAGSIGSARVARGQAGAVDISDVVTLDERTMGPGRWPNVAGQTLLAAVRQAPPGGWLGPTVDPACADLLVPGATLPCGATALRQGPAWIGARPLIAVGDVSDRRLLVALGMEWSSAVRLPPRPTPWSVVPPGAWRHGPSARFTLAELPAGEATAAPSGPLPTHIEPRVGADATVRIAGRTGDRLLVWAVAMSAQARESASGATAEPAPEELQEPEASSADGVAGPSSGPATVARIPVPPGAAAGPDDGIVPVDLVEVSVPRGAQADRWSLTIAPLTGWGEVGSFATELVVRDMTGPTLAVDAPFLSPIWPIAARVTGVSEPGAVVAVEGAGRVTVQPDGPFAIETALAPWPQTLRITATDQSGNITVSDVSVVGGLDYRVLPWAAIATVGLLVLVVASAVRGSSGARSADLRAAGGTTDPGSGRSRMAARSTDEMPGPEIEELPPGAGLPIR